MRIHLPEYTKHYNLIPFKTEEELSAYNATFGISRDAIDLDNYVLYWGNKDYSPHICKKYGVMETGFFHNASFIDTVGNKFAFFSVNSESDCFFDGGVSYHKKLIKFFKRRNINSFINFW